MTAPAAVSVSRGLWFVCVAATAWGTGGAVAAVLDDRFGLGPVAVSWWRFVGGVVLLASARRWFGPRGPMRFPRGSWRTVAVTGCGLAIYQTAYFVAVVHSGLAVATVITLGAGPVLIATGARVARIEPPDRTGPAAAGVALVGLVLLVGTGSPSGDGVSTAIGVCSAVLSAAGYATVTLLTRRGTGLDRYDTALGGFGVGAVLLAPFALVDGALPVGGAPVAAAGLLLYLMVVPTAVAYVLFFAGLAVVRATTASVVALVEPVTAAVVAVALLGERLTAGQVAGGALLLTTVLLLMRSESTAGEVPPRPAGGDD